jgi:ABC-type sugar transport system substrate-binding protein
MKRTRLLALAAALATLALPLSACSDNKEADTGTASSAGDASSASDSYTIGSMIWNVSNPFYTNFIVGQEETAASLGVKLTIVDGKADIGTEVAAVQQLISAQVDAILITPSDAVGITPVVKKANEAGIPVFAVNNRADDEAADIVTFIGADDYEFGRQQANLVVQALNGEGKIAYMLGQLGTSAQLLRKQGFDEVLAENPGITVLEEQTANWDSAEALALTQDWLNKYPAGTIDAIVDQGPEGANAAKYTADSGRTDIKFIVGDYPAEVRNGIKAGYIYGTIDQDPKPQGARSVEAAVQWLKGEKSKVTQPNEYLDLPIVTIDNVEDYPAAWGE